MRIARRWRDRLRTKRPDENFENPSKYNVSRRPKFIVRTASTRNCIPAHSENAPTLQAMKNIVSLDRELPTLSQLAQGLQMNVARPTFHHPRHT
jgi:hypothetical protein